MTLSGRVRARPERSVSRVRSMTVGPNVRRNVSTVLVPAGGDFCDSIRSCTLSQRDRGWAPDERVLREHHSDRKG